MVTMTVAPMVGPKMVPIPPSKVISTTSPDICQPTSVKVAKPKANDLVAPAIPANAPDKTNAVSLYLETSYPKDKARGSFSRMDFNTWPNGEWMTR